MWKNILNRKSFVLNRVELFSKNLLNNYSILEEKSKGKIIFPVIKANAYGHGIEEIAIILSKKKPKYFIVDSYYEALKVKSVSKVPVLIIAPNHLDNLRYIIQKKFILSITNIDTLKKINLLNKKVEVHLMFNTGMNREGLSQDKINSVLEILKNNSKIKVEGIFSHFATAGNNNSFLEKQEKEFSKIIDIFENKNIKFKWIHLGNSDGFLKTKDKRINSFRIGRALYGVGVNNINKIKPVLRLTTKITGIRALKNDDTVGYDRLFKPDGENFIGLIPIGYNEFLRRDFKNIFKIKYKNNFFSIIGNISMNMSSINFQNENVKIGDDIIVISEKKEDKNSIDNISQETGVLDYELLTSISSSHRRIIID